MIRHLRDDEGREIAADCFTRDGFGLADCTLGLFRRLKRPKALWGLIASREGRPYTITRLGLDAVRAQLDNR